MSDEREKLRITPVTLKEARRFVDRHHRHLKAPQGGLFAVAVSRGGQIVGVAVTGRPVARMLDDGYTGEITRLCVVGENKNACSMLYAASWRAAKAMGYRKLITYSREDEPGTSLEAAGWKVLGKTKDGAWDTPSRPRVNTEATGQKTLWGTGDTEKIDRTRRVQERRREEENHDGVPGKQAGRDTKTVLVPGAV